MLLNQGIDESLFTELTADQAEMLEGGKRIDILSVRCIQAGGGSDKLRFSINGGKISSTSPTFLMQTNSVANVGISENFDGTANVRLFDFRNRLHFPVGSFSSSSIGQQTQRVSGDGSTYEVTYKITN